MSSHRRRAVVWSILWALGAPAFVDAAEPVVDLSGYRPSSGVSLEREGDELRLSWTSWWAIDGGEHGTLVLDLRAGHPLIRTMAMTSVVLGQKQFVPIVENADPVTYLLVGRRRRPLTVRPA